MCSSLVLKRTEKKNEFVLGMGSVGKCFLTKMINGVAERMSD
jgi:hypothetical protein